MVQILVLLIFSASEIASRLMFLLKKIEQNGDKSERLALTEELKTMPLSLVWDYYCEKNSILPSLVWIKDAQQYEKSVLSKR